MSDVGNFYDELDLKYPEIAICIERIDRVNPGTKKFIIPVLTPNLSKDGKVENTIHQYRSSNIANANDNLEIGDLVVKNYIEISIPKELCALPSAEYYINYGNVNIASNQEGHGVVSELAGYINVNGTVKGSIKGSVMLTPTEDYRYIDKGSKWIVVFIGGDITQPKIIARY